MKKVKAFVRFSCGEAEELIGERITLQRRDGGLWLTAWEPNKIPGVPGKCARHLLAYSIRLDGEREPGYEPESVLIVAVR